MDDNWEYIGRGVAKEIGIDPTSIEYIEAKGFLCHELLYLLGGRIEFVFTPWWRLFRRLGDILFGVFPVCRWHPPEDSILEWVGHDGQLETKVYRLSPNGDTGQKRWVKTMGAFAANGFDWDAVYEINSVDRDAYTSDQDIE